MDCAKKEDVPLGLLRRLADGQQHILDRLERLERALSLSTTKESYMTEEAARRRQCRATAGRANGVSRQG